MLPTLFTVASSVSLLFSIADAAALPRAALTTRELTGYTYDGCYTEATFGRALSGNAYFDDL